VARSTSTPGECVGVNVSLGAGYVRHDNHNLRKFNAKRPRQHPYPQLDSDYYFYTQPLMG
jgi:hypothetical protein